MQKITNIKTKMLITAAIFVYALFVYLFKIPCIILSLTGIDCLGCGMTRALASVIKLDFSKAFSYHIMFWSLPVLYLFFLYDGKLFKNEKLNISILCLIFLGFVINWAFRTIF